MTANESRIVTAHEISNMNIMSITYTISRLSKPFKKDLRDILEYKEYERYCIYDEEDYYTGAVH